MRDSEAKRSAEVARMRMARMLTVLPPRFYTLYNYDNPAKTVSADPAATPSPGDCQDRS